MSFSDRRRRGFARRRRKLLSGMAVAVLAFAPLISAGTANAAPQSVSNPALELWPKLAPFQTLTVATLAGGTAEQQLAATTLEGAYNQLQGPNRLYVAWNPDDQTWLNDGVLPKGDSWSALQGQGSGVAGQLDAMLADYGHDIKGAIIVNPSDADTTNLATTMAGIDDAMVAEPDQIPLLQQYGIPVIYSFADTTFASPTAAYQWELTNLFPKTNPKDLVILGPGSVALRDYIIATKSFVFYLTSTNSAEKPLMNQIISSRPANTPIMGYVASETPDVTDLSSLGDFLNGSDQTDNMSDWAAVPSLTRLAQPKPRPVRASKNTVYVAFLVSDGDNADYVEQSMFSTWSGAGSYLGAVPEGWTIAPGMADYAPSLINWYYQHLPSDSEMLAGPSGVGYATYITGSDLQRFAQLSGGFMREDSMSTVDSYEVPSKLAAFAKTSGVSSIFTYEGPMVYTQEGKTAVLGLTNGYVTPASTLLSTIEQDALNELNSRASSPIFFLEPLVNGFALNPQDVLAISQALASWGKTMGENFVFLTPSELALTEEAYHQGTGSSLPELNAQAVSGASLLKLPSAGQLQGYTPPASVTGPNLVDNPSGQDGTTDWTDTAGTLGAGTYQGSPDITWSVPANQGPNPTDPGSSNQWAHVYPAVTNGDTYRFTVQVAGSGQVFMDVYTGKADNETQAVKLGSSYKTLTWVATIPSNAPTGQTGNAPQLQVREIGLGPVSVHIKNATVQLASTSS